MMKSGKVNELDSRRVLIVEDQFSDTDGIMKKAIDRLDAALTERKITVLRADSGSLPRRCPCGYA